MTAEEALAAAQKEGLTLVKTEGKSGFQNVKTNANAGKARPYRPMVWRDGKEVSLGSFATPEQAALVYARSPEGRKAAAAAAAAAELSMTAEEALAAAQKEGLTLVKTEGKSGFKNVSLNQTSKSAPYVALARRDGKPVNLGSFATAEEAALVVARHKAEAAAVEPVPRATTTANDSGGSSGSERPRHTPLQEDDDDQVGGQANPVLQASQRKRKVTHACNTDDAAEREGVSRVPIVLDTTNESTMFHRDDAFNRELLKWFETHRAALGETVGGKRSKVFKRGTRPFDELLVIVQPMLDKADLCLAECNALVYENGKVSMILPHRDSHHNILERVTIVFDVTRCAPGDTLHMDVPGHGHRRVPDAEPGQQLTTVMTSAANQRHCKLVDGRRAEMKDDVVSLALWCYLKPHEDDLLQLHDASENGEATHLSGMSTLVHDVDMCDVLRNQPRIDVRKWPEGRPDVLEAVQQEQARLAKKRKEPLSDESPRPESREVDLPSFQGQKAVQHCLLRRVQEKARARARCVREARAAPAAPVISQPEEGAEDESAEDESASASPMEVGGVPRRAPRPAPRPWLLPPIPDLVSAAEHELNPDLRSMHLGLHP